MSKLGWEIREDEKAAAAREAGCERQSRQEARRTKVELKELIQQLADIVSDAITELETNGDPDNEPWLGHARATLAIARKVAPFQGEPPRFTVEQYRELERRERGKGE